MSLLYLKLLSGEEIIGETEITAGKFVVKDPLMFETGLDEKDPSRRYVYMARFAPFLNDFRVELDQQKVMFHGAPSETVTRYYDVSLNYCRTCTDTSFNNCVSQTTQEIAEVLKPNKKKSVIEKDELLEQILMAAPGPSRNVH